MANERQPDRHRDEEEVIDGRGGELPACRDDPGYRWVVFAALTLLLLGTANLVEGLAAVGNPRFFIHHPRPFLDNLIIWGSGAPYSTPGSLAALGWIGVLVGPAEIAIGCGVLVKNQLSRASGMVVLGLHASAQLVVMRPDSPLSAATFTLDLLAVYALTRYGGQGKERPSRQMIAWRRSAAEVTRAWSEWLTADGRESSEHYRRYVCALAEEERAAGEVKRAIYRGGADSEIRRGQEFHSCDGPRTVRVTRGTRADDPASDRTEKGTINTERVHGVSTVWEMPTRESRGSARP